MAINITVAPKFSRRVARAPLRKLAHKTLRHEQVGTRQSLTVLIVGDRQLRELNRRFHHVDARTDVLAFSSDERDYLGDVIISYETARANALIAHWRIRDELALLVVHGMLHLLGYDDKESSQRAVMWQRQSEILGAPLPIQGTARSTRKRRGSSTLS